MRLSVSEITLQENSFSPRRFCAGLLTQAYARQIALAFWGACLTGVLAQVKVALPWTPVPVSGQTLGVLLCGALLGSGWGAVSQLLYVSLGVAGIPWFSGAAGGWAILAGPTGGYLAGFVLAALFLGHVSETYVRSRGFLPLAGLMLVATFGLIHSLGLLQLWLWTRAVQGTAPAFSRLLWMGTLPFLPGDFVKIALAASAGRFAVRRSDQ